MTERDEDPEAVGPAAVALARRALESAVAAGTGRDLVRRLFPGGEAPPLLGAARGVFVTLETYPTGALRGCIGFPLPVYPLFAAIPRAAAAAALEDPRFPPVAPRELPKLTVEVSVLTVPEPLPGPPSHRAAQVEVGRDGLIVETSEASGLLLPQVAPEQGWSAEEFLDGTCEKADLPRGAWRNARTTVQRFRAEVFREERPGGAVRRSDAVRR